MRPHCWVMVALAGIMSYLSPERALGAPQREGERRMDGCEDGRMDEGVGGAENLSVMKGRALTGCGV